MNISIYLNDYLEAWGIRLQIAWRVIAFFAVSSLALIVSPANADLSIAQYPLFTTANVPPLVMLNISKDHQLSYKAFNDYSDLDGDGTPETTYKDSINYYGYFDSYKCYTYDTTNNRFNPDALSSGANSHYCSGEWSGNFLNWASMTRMDAVRKLLYGGKRSTDGTGASGTTVLERAFLPTDAHAFAKWYNGSDIASLTPFSGIATTAPTGTSTSTKSIPTSAGNITFTTSLAVNLGDQVKFQVATDSTQWMIGTVETISGTSVTIYVPSGGWSGSGSFSNWTVSNLSQTGISFCNLTKGSSSGTNQYSENNTNPPILRVAKGNHSLWSANERWQCYWSGEHSNTESGFSSYGRSNGNLAALSGLNSSAENPKQSTDGLGTGSDGSGSQTGEYVVRVQACVSSLLGQERCKLYPSGDYKPIGLLQNYGDTNLLDFGLMTGSYTKNISGGVLRKNLGSFTSEVNVSTDGTFTSASNSGIVGNLNKLKMYGYNYSDGTYIGDDSCTYQQTGMVHSGGQTNGGYPANEGNCSSWGNPMSEIYLESLRYMAGKSPTSAFTYGSGTTKDSTLGLTVATWSDPLSESNYCAPLEVLNFNASVSSYDSLVDVNGNSDNQLGGISDLGSSSSASALTDTVGTDEGITGGSWYVGATGTSSDKLCTSKAISSFGSIFGICPEAPTAMGSYLMSGIAYYAHTNQIRSDLTVPSTDTKSLKVNTYGIALASSVPKIQVTVNGKTVTILPAYRLSVGSGGGGTLVDFKIISQTATSGKYYINWEDSGQGGDYDQDMWGTISYSVSGSNITITTDAIAAATSNGQGFGYTISGTDKDGVHFHSGIYGFNYTDPTGVTGCSNCQVGDAATSAIYTVSSSSGGVFQDPLWYAAKYGGFTDSNGNDQPDLQSEWDSLNADGTSGSDGVPDNFFSVTNPNALEKSLDQVFLKILSDASASSVAANSTQLNTNSYIYQARFSTSDWSGDLRAYAISTAGVVATTPTWSSATAINAQASTSSDTRFIITKGSSGNGAIFSYANLSTLDQAYLNTGYGGATDNCGLERLAYLRGQRANEGSTGTFTCATTPNNVISKFRVRPTSVLGDIVNSNPVYVGAPSAGYAYPGYSSFYTTNASRTPTLYVGANDGMLHGFKASDGTESLAYIPTPVYANLSGYTDNSYISHHHYEVDSSPMVGDACLTNCGTSATGTDWKTVLVSGLGAGGKGYFALDVTNPANFTSANAASLLLWEFTTADDADLGYTYNSSPQNSHQQSKQIVRMKVGGVEKWAVVLGNGYNSANGYAVLYILFINDGIDGWTAGDFVKITLDTSGNNGLSTPVVIDSDNDGYADTVYAGDLKGNMWKVLIGANSSDTSVTDTTTTWKAAFSGNPLYHATYGSVNQPIIYAPIVSPNPTSGYMVEFGTGKYIETSDPSSTAMQSLYGIWDNDVAVSGRTQLDQELISTITVNSVDYRTITAGTTATTPPASAWYMDLTSGERATGNPFISGGTSYFNTFIPSANACDFGGTGWLLAVNYLDGSTPAAMFDTNGDGTVDASDTAVSGVQIGAALGGTVALTGVDGGAASGLGVLLSSTTNAGLSSMKYKPTAKLGRISWRELFN
jgi:type IV pilus assembly protein PilY1